MISCTIFHHLYWPINREETNRGDQISRHFLDQSEETKIEYLLTRFPALGTSEMWFASSFDWLIELRASVIDNYVVLVFQITTNNWDEVGPNLEIYFD